MSSNYSRIVVKTVVSLDGTLAHIHRFGVGHSECIISDCQHTVDHFLRYVDAACVYANAFPSVQEEIITYKRLIRGNGQIREN